MQPLVIQQGTFCTHCAQPQISTMADGDHLGKSIPNGKLRFGHPRANQNMWTKGPGVNPSEPPENTAGES